MYKHGFFTMYTLMKKTIQRASCIEKKKELLHFVLGFEIIFFFHIVVFN